MALLFSAVTVTAGYLLWVLQAAPQLSEENAA